MTFVFLRSGKKFSADYAKKLFLAIRYNSRLATRIVCVTDQPECPGERVDLPEELCLQGWWWKVWLFSPEFRAIVPERFVYIDLDTIITGQIDFLAGYTGKLAMLEDFYMIPPGYGSGVMLVGEGFGEHIWTEFKYPDSCERWGDQVWIAKTARCEIDKLQNLYPGKLVSYKVHCREAQMPPAGAAIVCFHGRPRPDQVTDEVWVKKYW
jgi:hypothetical protein